MFDGNNQNRLNNNSSNKQTMKRIFLVGFLAIAFIGSAFAQRTVTGTVTSSEDGLGLPGVNVIVKGTASGVSTDLDGKYRISVPGDNAVLEFSYIGYVGQEVTVGARSVIDITLDPDVKQLGEVVVTALGFADQRDNLGQSVATVDAELVAKAPEANLIGGLAGKAAGVQIISSSGDPGAGSYIQIRGQSTLTGGVQPLIVVDGVPIYNSSLNSEGSTGGVTQQSRLNDLNPNDIESIQVLKGASAAALWGSRAANGVIVITTKQGKKGRLSVSYTGRYSIDQINKNHPLQTTYGQGFSGAYSPTSAFSWGDVIADRAGGADVVDETSATYAVGRQTGTTYRPILTKNDNTVYQNSNFDQVFQNGSFFDNSISISGGSENGNFLLSFGDLNQQGIYQGVSDYRRSTVRANATTKVTDYLTLRTNVNYSKIGSNRIQKGSNLAGLFLGLLRTPADFDISDYQVDVYDSNDVIIGNGYHRSYRRYLGSTNAVYNNPLWTINRQPNISNLDRILGNVEANIKATDNLSIILRPGIDTYSEKRITHYPVYTGGISTGSTLEENLSQTQVNFDGIARYTQDFGGVNFTGLVGYNYNSRQTEWVWSAIQNFIITDDDGYLNSNNASAIDASPGDFTQVIKTNAAYTQLGFEIADQLNVNLTGRLEAASSFAGQFFYPAADVAWRFTEMIGANDILSFGKLRAAYGQVGVQPAPYAQAQYFGSAFPGDGGWGGGLDAGVFGGSFLISGARANSNIEPERKTEIEGGADLRFFEDKVRVGFTYYWNENANALFSTPIAASSGFTSQYRNAGTLQNSGIELELGVDLISDGDFKWSLNGNFNRNRNVVTDLGDTETIFLNGFTGTSSRIIEGYSIGTLWGGRWDRDDAGNIVTDAFGFPAVAETEGVLGDPNPDWRGGLGTSLSFKGLSLSVLFETFQGADYWNGTRGVLNYFGRSQDTDVSTTVSAAEAATLNTYTGFTVADIYAPNADGTYTFRGSVQDFGAGNVALDQYWYTSAGGGFGPVGEQFVDDASWTRLREVALAYTIAGEGFKSATGLSSIELGVRGRNLLLWTDWVGIDPETNLTGVSSGRGLEYFNNPNTRSFIFSLNITY